MRVTTSEWDALRERGDVAVDALIHHKQRRRDAEYQVSILQHRIEKLQDERRSEALRLAVDLAKAGGCHGAKVKEVAEGFAGFLLPDDPEPSDRPATGEAPAKRGH